MYVRLLNNKSLFDLALEYYSSLEMAFQLAYINKVSITSSDNNKLIWLVVPFNKADMVSAFDGTLQPIKIIVFQGVEDIEKSLLSFASRQTLFDIALLGFKDSYKAFLLAERDNIPINSNATEIINRLGLKWQKPNDSLEVATNEKDSFELLSQFAVYVSNGYVANDYIERKKVI